MTTKTNNQLKKVTAQNDFPFVSAGVAVAEGITGYVLNEDALTALVEASEAAEAAQAMVTELEEQLNTASAGNTEIQSKLDTANETINANNTRIQQLEEEVAALQAQEGITQTRKKSDDGGSKSKLPAHADPSAASNALADKLMGAPQSQEQ